MIKTMVPLIVTCIECDDRVSFAVEDSALAEWRSPRRRNVQEIFPDLTADQREMLMTRICPVCWDDMFAYDEDE